MRFFTLFLLFLTTVVFSQDKIKHTIAKGETIYSISKKYNVNEVDIYNLNPTIKGSSIQLNSILWIPNKNLKSKETDNLTITHLVLAKETLYGISKKYKTTVDKIKEVNPLITKNGLKEGNSIIIPVSKEIITSQSGLPTNTLLSKIQKPQKSVSQNTDEIITHNVLAKETKYGISKRYNISITELEKLNPKIVKGLSIGDQLIIRQGKTEESKIVVTSQNNNNNVIPTSKKTTTNILSTSDKAEYLITKASENIGIPYLFGGTDKNGFDCSGLIFCTYKQIDITLPRTSSDMATNAGIKIDKNQAQKGDLLFFDTMNQGTINHVGMVTEVLDNEIKFIHASTSSGVMISSTKEDYFTQRLIQVNRILEN
ncbi:MAG: NlpC/P60 family protein [Flavobacterium sp.]